MPIAEKYNVLFIHIPKNAGKTVEIMLGIHGSYKGSPNARSRFNALMKFLLTKSMNKLALCQLIGVIDKSFASQHLTLQEIELNNFIKAETLNSLIKLAIVRDPFDRAFSLFNHWVKNVDVDCVEEEFYRFLNSIDERRMSEKHSVACHFRNQIDFLRNTKGEYDSVSICRLENLEKDLLDFCDRHGVEVNVASTLKATVFESDSKTKRKAMSSRNGELVFNLFMEDYKHFNYNKVTSNVIA
ncbi:MAG: sulfotransferase family 2 domain-containing protein [Paraglaciecola sp.]|uniref:sulfotransferase family 2 domain-containing protein n=1 Tax=Paraglaciecola sp. TaxID=1920173 RepID=UPI003298C6B4